jgi:predicted ATP-grasp superfamily ATP-dependent carboligase
LNIGRFEELYDPDALITLAGSLVEEEYFDAILLSSGLDDEFRVLNELSKISMIMGNPPEVIRSVRDRENFFEKLRHLKIHHPRTELSSDLYEAKIQAKDIGYPIVLKPTKGFSGSGIRKVEDVENLEREYTHLASWSKGGVLIQKFVEGFHTSISFLASKHGTKVLTLNEQLLGLNEVFQLESFGYCGNIVPLKVPESTYAKCQELVATISEKFNLLGSNGIDLVVDKDGTPNLIEVNPRFQGTLECVEKVLGINLVSLHLEACQIGSLPRDIKPKQFCSRLILFAPQRLTVPDLTRMTVVRDMPVPGSIIEEGQPVCSVISTGESRKASFQSAMTKAEEIYRLSR